MDFPNLGQFYIEPKPKEPTFMDRYTRARGFRWREDERCYFHASGAWIAKSDSLFSWNQHNNGSDCGARSNDCMGGATFETERADDSIHVHV